MLVGHKGRCDADRSLVVDRDAEVDFSHVCGLFEAPSRVVFRCWPDDSEGKLDGGASVGEPTMKGLSSGCKSKPSRSAL